MKQSFFHWITGNLIIIGIYSVLAVHSTYAYAGNDIQNPKISWSSISPLTFSGRSGETQTGEVNFIINTSSKSRGFLVRITGTPLSRGNVELETYYQFGGNEIQYRAGDSFFVWCVPGKPHKIIFKATTGPHISSQAAGDYTAKLTLSLSNH